MSRHLLSLSPEQLTAFDLDAFIAQAELLNQHNRETFTTPFPKAPRRWLSHYGPFWGTNVRREKRRDKPVRCRE